MRYPKALIRLCILVAALLVLSCDLGTFTALAPTATPTPSSLSSTAPTPTSAGAAATPTQSAATRLPTTQSRGPITVVSPNGGEQWIVGEVRPLHWNWDGKFESVRLEYSTDGGTTWRTIATSAANDGAQAWTVPNTPSATAKVKITNAADPNAFDVSDANFAILAPTITVTRPSGGELYVAGETRPIHWNWTGKIPNVRLEYSTDSGATWRTISTSVDGDGNFAWQVPNTLSSTSRLKITDTANPNAFGVSGANFTIGTRATAPNPITVTSPMSGDAWLAGREYYVTWAPTQGIRELKIEYSANGGVTWDMVTARISNVGYFRWRVPSTPCTNCKIKISDATNPSVFRDSDVFTILPQTITLTSPRSGDLWYVGRSYVITWNVLGGLRNLKLEYSINDGATWNLITATTSNDGFYTWKVPNTPGVNCRIRISNPDDPKVLNISDTFEIR